MLLFCFVVVIVHAWIFCLCFSQKQSANQVKKKYRGMLCYWIEKHMQKFKLFWRKKNFTWKSHLRPSCTKLFNCINLKVRSLIGYHNFVQVKNRVEKMGKGFWKPAAHFYQIFMGLPTLLLGIRPSRFNEYQFQDPSVSCANWMPYISLLASPENFMFSIM